MDSTRFSASSLNKVSVLVCAPAEGAASAPSNAQAIMRIDFLPQIPGVVHGRRLR
jgi:hypothetical protein